MKFDVIIGNPPYQINDGGAKASAKPIYQIFVEQAKKLNPHFLSMIIPARWYGGGKGLDNFRHEMITDKRIRVLHDFLNSTECFGKAVEIKGGICYFLWDRDNLGKCKVYTHSGGNVTESSERYLRENESDVFIRYNQGVSVYRKVCETGETSFATLVSSQKPFGLRTYVHGKRKLFNGSIRLYQNGGIGYIKRSVVTKNQDWIDKYKIYISAAYNAGDNYPHQILGKPIFGDKGTCCTETYVSIGPFKTKNETQNAISYIYTKFFRFLVMLKKTSQHAAAQVYSFVPIQDFSKPWTDKELYTKYGLTDKEVDFIESMIKPMDANEGETNGSK